MVLSGIVDHDIMPVHIICGHDPPFEALRKASWGGIIKTRAPILRGRVIRAIGGVSVVRRAGDRHID